MSAEKPKYPKPGAVARIRDAMNKLRKQPVSPELRDILKKQPTKQEPTKKIAKKRDPDLGL